MKKSLLLMVCLTVSGVISAVSAFVPTQANKRAKTGRARVVEKWTAQDHKKYRIPDEMAYDPKRESLLIWGCNSDLNKLPYDYEISELWYHAVIPARNLGVDNSDPKVRRAQSGFNDHFNQVMHPQQ